MALAQKESTFRTDEAGSGAVGIMQIMPATAMKYGITRSELLDAHTNIEFGSKYIADKVKYYGDTTVALSAYNQGGAAVSRGSYSTRYATNITGNRKRPDKLFGQQRIRPRQVKTAANLKSDDREQKSKTVIENTVNNN